uniref:Uncharacterized protein n=1 Tax=Rhizophora mucronata TaxID=61149 RepID=A0A2P2R4B9_RHIMU
MCTNDFHCILKMERDYLRNSKNPLILSLR